MAKLDIINLKGEKTSDLKLNDSIWHIETNDVVLKKARQLLLPVFSWGIFIFMLYLALDAFMSEYFTILSYGDAFSKAFDNFWFLKSLFLCYMLAWCSKRTGLSVPLWVVLSLIISQLFPFYNVKVMYPCFLFGVFVRHYSQCIERYKIPLFCSRFLSS